MSGRHAAAVVVVVALQAVVFACATAQRVGAPILQATVGPAEEAAVVDAAENDDGSADAGGAAWVREVCLGEAADALVASASPELVEDCYPQQRASWAPLVPVRLVSCASFARDVVLVRDPIDVAEGRGYEFPGLAAGPVATTIMPGRRCPHATGSS